MPRWRSSTARSLRRRIDGLRGPDYEIEATPEAHAADEEMVAVAVGLRIAATTERVRFRCTAADGAEIHRLAESHFADGWRSQVVPGGLGHEPR